jgi:rhodanese-related sulfurtransferase
MNDPEMRDVPEANKTVPGLYLLPAEAYALWKSDPDRVRVLDVRTFEEYIFGGHADMAQNIPLLFPRFAPPGEASQAAPAASGRPPGCSGEMNTAFISTAKSRFSPSDTILVMCATGGRAAVAVNLLAEAGFKKVYNIINGFEGDRVNDPASVYHGKHMRNGWKNNGLPWTYDFDPDLMWVQPAS